MGAMVTALTNTGLPIAECTSPIGYRTPDDFEATVAMELFREIPTLAFMIIN